MTKKLFTHILLTTFMVAFVGFLSFLSPQLVNAAAPTGTSAVIQNSTATTVDIVITGTDFVTFVGSGTATANAADLLGIIYNATNPTSAVINNITTITATFPISIGTAKSGSLIMSAGTVQDAGSVVNALITIVDGSITDSAAPVITSRTYQDNGTNGSVDRLVLVFSETVTQNGSDLNQFNITENNLTGFTAASAMSGSGTISLTLTVGATTDLTGVSGGTEPTVQYTQSGTSNNRVKDSLGNDMASEGSASSITDSAAPVFVSGVYQDTNNDGQVETLALTFSETIATNTVLIAEFTYVANDITSSVLTGGANSGDTGSATITLTLGTNGDANITSHTTAPTLAYTDVGGTLLDGASNQAVDFTATNLGDGAAPVIVVRYTLDIDNNGQIDVLGFFVSENLDDASGFGGVTVSVTGYTVTGVETGPPPPNDNTFGAIFTESGSGDTGITPTVQITGNTTLRDLAGNLLVAEVGVTVAVDVAEPTVAITSSETSPTTTTPIPMTATFSESVIGFAVGDITVGNGTAGSFAGSGAVYTFNVTPAAGGAVTVDIAVAVAIDGGSNSNTAATQFSITYNASSGGVAVISTAPPAAPEGGFSIVINDDALATASQEVTLSFTAGSNVARMAISNSSGFDGAIQETYASPKTWMLSEGDGEKTVYVKFYNENGVATDVVSDSIALTVINGTVSVPAEEAVVFTKFLVSGSRGDEVRNLQEVLVNQGFDPGLADGIFGSRTCEAVKAFQSAQGLLVDCIVGSNTQSALNTLGASAPAPTPVEAATGFSQFLVDGVRSDDVLRLQQFLNTHGYPLTESGFGSAGNETNYFGSLTEGAVKKFQTGNNLLADGVVGPNTRAALNSLLGQ